MSKYCVPGHDNIMHNIKNIASFIIELIVYGGIWINNNFNIALE